MPVADMVSHRRHPCQSAFGLAETPRGPLRNSGSAAGPDNTDTDLLPRWRLAASSVLVLGAGLRLYGLNLQSAWADEIATLVIQTRC